MWRIPKWAWTTEADEENDADALHVHWQSAGDFEEQQHEQNEQSGRTIWTALDKKKNE